MYNNNERILIFNDSLCMNGLARGAIFLSEKGIEFKISEIYLAIFFSRWMEPSNIRDIILYEINIETLHTFV